MTLAVTLVHAGESLSRIDPIPNDEMGKVAFCFAPTTTLDESLQRAWRKDVQAPIQTVIHTVRTIKARIKYVQKDNNDRR